MNMKKVLCAMLAGATVLSMSAVSVFAQWAYDGDGKVTNDVPNQFSWGGLGASSNFTLDPIRPGSTVYIPLFSSMNDDISAGQEHHGCWR